MRLKKIDFKLDKNIKLAVCEKGTRADEQLEYSSIVGIFGKNGVGKTRALKTVYNTIKYAIENDNEELLEGITDAAKKKVLFLDAKKILEIKNGSFEQLTVNNGNPFDEKQIVAEGMQKYLIMYGKSLLRFLGTRWYEVSELSENHPSRFFLELFRESFGVEFRTVLDPESYQPNLQMDSLDIDKYELSDGEWIVVFYLLLVTLVKCTEDRFSDAIVIIDELENYLNPANIRKVFEILKDAFAEKGQIWVASHSLDVLLMIDSRRVYRLDKRERKTVINKPSISNYNKVREELYGDKEESLSSLRFREDEMQHYFVEFMSQCLSDPTTVRCINENDIQLRLFLKCLGAEQRELKILDFGAGQGRIGEALKKLKDSRISYYAYDINESNMTELQKKSYVKKAYYRKEDITEKFEIVLLCNVLHEIDILSWESELRFILNRLTDNGILVFIEDLELPMGEYIGETGFLLLDGEMTQKLFGKENVSLILAKEEKYRKRILCAAINKKSVISTSRIIDALELMKRRNIEKIWQIRRNKKDKFVLQQRELGTIMARAAQLVVNSDIAMEYLKSVELKAVEPMKRFVDFFVSAIGLVDAEKSLDISGLEKCLMEVWTEFEKEGNMSWVSSANVVLTGSFIQRINRILEKKNLKIYHEKFEGLVELYSGLKISEWIAEHRYKELMARLVFLDLNNKYGLNFV